MKLFSRKTIYTFLAFYLCMAFSNNYLNAQIDFEILNAGSDICAGDSTLLSIDATVDSVQWSPTTGVSMPNALTTFVSPNQSTTYFATLFSGGVTTNVRFEVDVFSAPDLGSDVTVCEAAILNFDLSDLPNPTDYNLTSNSNFSIQEPSTNQFIVIVGSGNTGTFDVVATSVCGQSDTTQVTVLDGSATQITLNTNETDFTICTGDEINLAVNSPSNTTTFEWFANGTSISTSNSISENPTVTTIYSVEATDVGCSVPTTQEFTVTVNAPPAVSLPETINGCENDIIELGNNIAQANTTYSWLPTDNIIDPSVVNAELLVVEDGRYVLIATNGCTIQDTVDVVLIPNDIEISEDTLFVCKGDSVEVTWTTNPPNDDVVWTDIEGVPLSNVANPFVVSPQDVVTFVGTVENNGCTFSDTVTIQVDSLPDFPELELIELDMMPPICRGDTVLLQDNPIFAPNLYPNITFQWFTGDSTSIPPLPGQLDGFLTPDSLLQVLFIGSTSMDYNRLNINGACRSTSSIFVEVIPILEIDIQPEGPVCPGESFTVMGIPSDPSDPDLVVSADDLDEWDWMTSSGTIEPADDPEPLLTVGQFNGTESVSVNAMYMGCPAMGQRNIEILVPPPISLPNSPICPGDIVSLNSATIGDLNGYTYTWTSTSTNDGLAGNENEPNPMVFPLVTTTYTVTISHDECNDVFEEFTLEVFDALGTLPELNLSGCEGDVLTVGISDPNFDVGPGGQISWVNRQTGVVDTIATSFDLLLSQNIDYNIFVENACTDGPQLVGSAFITVQPRPVVEILCDTTAIFSGQQVAFGASPDLGNGTYSWSSSAGGNFSPPTGPNTTYLVPDNIDGDIITVSGDIGGCAFETSKSIRIVEFDVVLPNIFTPGASENNVYRLRAVDGAGEPINLNFDVTNLVIYDRWGNKVYENDNVDQEWDGTINGEPAPSEVYIVTATIVVEGGVEMQKSTDLTLLR